MSIRSWIGALSSEEYLILFGPLAPFVTLRYWSPVWHVKTRGPCLPHSLTVSNGHLINKDQISFIILLPLIFVISDEGPAWIYGLFSPSLLNQNEGVYTCINLRGDGAIVYWSTVAKQNQNYTGTLKTWWPAKLQTCPCYN